ncbi:MAG: glycoside hydrolase family 9 protein [Pseudomonadota bacterium]
MTNVHRHRAVRRFIVAALLALSSNASAALQIAENQLGYLPNAAKSVRLLSDRKRAAIKYSLRGRQLSKTGKSSAFTFEPLAQTWVATIDLSDIRQVGNHVLRVGDQTVDIIVADTVYRNVLQKLLRSYFLQRCGVALADGYTGLEHLKCHHEDGVVDRSNEIDDGGTRIDASGGWHDAGDYGKYVSTTAVALIELLHQYESFPRFFANINQYTPANQNGVPDILDEAIVGLNWLTKMQRGDGAFYRKLSGKSWPKLVPPDQDNQTRWLFGIATDDTAKAVAALAAGSRVLKRISPTASRRYMKAAKRGWRYLEKHPDFEIDLGEEDDKGSGPYRANKIDKEPSLSNDRDDRIAAAVELYFTARDSRYLKAVSNDLQQAPIDLFEWKNPSLIAIARLLHGKPPRGYADTLAGLRERVVARADEAIERTESNRFGLANLRIVWGSNKMIAEEGNLLLLAYGITADDKYLAAAAAQLHYLFGSNPQRLVFVTGVGLRRVEHISHIFARAEKLDIPGLFVGGANELAQAGIAPKDAALLSYADDGASYATNEYAIDYNSALIALLGNMMNANESLYP